MGVYVKGMKMPGSCANCGFAADVGNNKHLALQCGVNAVVSFEYAERHKDCPLIEVKTPHGRLIDGDILEEQFYEAYDIESSCTVSDTETVIDAEK